MILRGTHAEELVVAAGLFDAGVEDHEVVHDLQQPFLAAKLVQPARKGIIKVGRLLPFHPELLGRLDHPIAQAFGGVAGHHQLRGGEKRLDKLGFLVVQALADAFCHRHSGALELQNAQGDTVDVQHHVRALVMDPGHRNLLGHGEVIVLGISPVNQPDGNRLLLH